MCCPQSVSHKFGRKAAGALLLSILLLLSCGSAGRAKTEILWDTYGVPHIFAPEEEGLFYAFGWAQMKSHGNLLLKLYGESRGRAAEYWGEQNLRSDRWLHRMGVPERARQWYGAQQPSFRAALDAFARGINEYARKHPEEIDEDMRVVLPVRPIDILAHVQRVIHFYFVVSPLHVGSQTRAWRAQGGSNAWAIAPSRSANGNAMLLANPHLPWSGFFRFYEAHLRLPDLNLYGATLVGFPALGIAFNEHLGWSHTVNTHDGFDLYELELQDGGYRWEGGVRRFETHQKIIKIKQPGGTFKEETLVVKRSIHGPVVSEENGRALALRVVGLDRPSLGAQWWEMGKAKNLAEFEAALQRLQIPMFTVIYADRDGHILHLFNGQVPVRPDGDWDWDGVVPGRTVESLWTETHPYDELPRVLDPPTGWLQNANDPPWTTTFPQVFRRSEFPPYMGRGRMNLRAQRSTRMLAADDRITFDELIEYKHSTRMELADRLLDDLIPAAIEYGGEAARRAAAVLEKWDRRAEPESRGAVLFEAFYREARESAGVRALFAEPWDDQSPRVTPDGLADPAAAAALLEAAARRIEQKYGSLDVPWGEVKRLRIGDLELPGNGGPGDLGIFRVTQFEKDSGDRFRAAGGDSFVAAVEFSEPVRARVLLSYGNASQPGQPHRADQLELYSQKKLRPAWLEREAIEENLESRTTF